MNTETPNAADTNNTNATAAEVTNTETVDVTKQTEVEQPNPDAAAPDSANKDEPAKADVSEVPEVYAAPQMPEGVVFDEALAEAMSPLLKEKGVTQAEYDALAGVLAQHQAQAAQSQLKAWNEAVAKDPEINANDGAVRKAAIDAVGQFGTPELKALFQTSGLGSHPDLVKFIGKLSMASRSTEDRGVETAAAGSGPRPIGDRLFSKK